MTLHLEVSLRLMDVEAELRRLQQWQQTSPGAEALASTEPFCVDTLTFSQWLQFVFLPRMQALSAAEQPLPERCEIAPMAEEYFLPLALDAGALIGHLQAIDALLNQPR